MKNEDEYLDPQDLKDETGRSIVIDKLKEMRFNDMNIMREILHLTDEREYIKTSNNAKVSLYEKILRAFEQFVFQAFLEQTE